MDPTYRRRTVLQGAGAVTLVNLGVVPGSARLEESLNADRHGPVRTGRFTVTVDGAEVPNWIAVAIPASETELDEYREGADPEHERKLRGRTTVGDLQLVRGFDPADTTVFDWREAILQGNVDGGRREVVVEVLDEEGQPQMRWIFAGAWVRAYDPPTLEASADGDVATESLTLAFDTMATDWDPTTEGVTATVEHESQTADRTESTGDGDTEADGTDQTDGDGAADETGDDGTAGEFSVEGPGFGVTSAIASLGGVYYLLRRQREE